MNPANPNNLIAVFLRKTLGVVSEGEVEIVIIRGINQVARRFLETISGFLDRIDGMIEKDTDLPAESGDKINENLEAARSYINLLTELFMAAYQEINLAPSDAQNGEPYPTTHAHFSRYLPSGLSSSDLIAWRVAGVKLPIETGEIVYSLAVSLNVVVGRIMQIMMTRHEFAGYTIISTTLQQLKDLTSCFSLAIKDAQGDDCQEG